MAEKRLSPAEERAPVLTVRMYHPAGGIADSFPHGDDGMHEVPNGPAVAELRAHGFLVEGETTAAVRESATVDPRDGQLAQLLEDNRELRRAVKTSVEENQILQAENAELRANLEEAAKTAKA